MITTHTPEQDRPELSNAGPLLHLDQLIRGLTGLPPLPASGGGNGEATEFVMKELENTGHGLGPVVVPGDTGAMLPNVLLAIVCYCYIKGIFASAEIEREMTTNRMIRQLCEGNAPDAAVIRRFRGANREVIAATLERYYRWVRHHWQMKVLQPPPPPWKGTGAAVEPASKLAATGGETEFLARSRAKEALRRACFVDDLTADF